MKTAPAIKTELTEYECFVRINGLTHIRFDRREFIGLESHYYRTGLHTPTYEIVCYFKSGTEIKSTYEQRNVWEAVIKSLDKAHIPVLG